MARSTVGCVALLTLTFVLTRFVTLALPLVVEPLVGFSGVPLFEVPLTEPLVEAEVVPLFIELLKLVEIDAESLTDVDTLADALSDAEADALAD